MKPAVVPVRYGAQASRGGTLPRALAFLVSALLAMTGLVTLSSPASADVVSDGVSASVTFPESHDGTPVLPEGGATGLLELSYQGSQVVPGKTYEITFPAGVLPKDLQIPADNTAITSLVYEDGKVKVTFADPFPAGIDQGKLEIKFQLNTVEKSKKTDFTWSLDQKSETVEVILKDEGDSFQDWTGTTATKNGGGNLTGISINGDKVVVGPAAANHRFDFTLVGTTKTAVAPYVVTDQLPAGMVYVPGSFAVQIETWDADGLNKTSTTMPFTPTPSGSATAGQSFSHSLDVPANSRVTVKYQASYDASYLPTLQDRLQALFPENPDGQWLAVTANNKATLNGSSEKTATVTAGVNAPTIRKPNVGTGTFNKTRDWAKQNIDPAADGTLNPAVPVTWTLTADLRKFVPPANATSTEIKYHKLTQNVVLRDVLPAQATWAMSDADFTALGLTKVTTCSTATTAATFADTVPMSYCLSGNTLWINVGTDTTKNHSFAVKAQINTVAGLNKTASTTIPGAFNYGLTNTLNVTAVTEARTYTADPRASVTLVDRPEQTDDGWNDADTFKKEGPPGIVSFKPGVAAQIPYTFTVNGNNSDVLNQPINAADVKVVDTVDTTIFDLSDLGAIKAKLTGSYNGSVNLVPADFTLTLEGTNRLVIELSPSGKAKAVPAHKKWTFVLTLPTHKVAGKQTLDLTNSADLVGTGQKVEYWTEDESTMSSYGSEAEVRKFIRDSKNGAWTGNLRAEFKDGELVQDTYVYKVEFLAHGTFKGKMFDVNDVLPANTQFVGFVTEANADTAANPSAGPVNIGGGITASYDATARTMSLKSNNVTQGARASAYFAVKIVAAEEDVPVVNRIGSVSATVTPTDGYPIVVAKMNSNDPTAVINDPSARFELRDSAGDVVVRDIFVENNQLRVTKDGKTKSVVVQDPGTYTLHETNPPKGYVKSDEVLTFVIAKDVVPPAQTFLNDPNPASVRVGDYVWIDKDHDGLQDAGEPAVEGVELKIEKVGADGTTVTPVTTGVNGMPITNQVTDASGKYHFELLPVLAAGEKYRVTIVKKPSTLDDYVPTEPGANNGAAGNDSSTNFSDTTKNLTQDKAEDLTLDFGFVKPYVSVGDYVWIDVNKDGVQQPGNDIVLPGVKLSLYGPDGTKVTHDVYGDPIVDQVTNAQGKYLFDNLPVLPAGQTYTVKIDKDDPANVAVLKGMIPTKDKQGSDREKDSSTWSSSSVIDLDVHQKHDPSLDFGFIRQAVSVGDYVWVDTDRDGLQGDPTKEPGIPGVLLEVYGPDGTKVTKDADGAPLPVVRTDANGKYSFDNLPALENPTDSYTVKIVRTDPDTVKALEPYVPTTSGKNNGEGSTDSSTWEAESTEDLSNEGSRDPSLDFGFTLKYVTVGDYVWIDKDRNGTQDAGNDVPVKDVVLTIQRELADGNLVDVTDVTGTPVDPTTTNNLGKYEFTLLPVLAAGEKYVVSIDRTKLPSTLDNYVPTTTGAGTPATDSEVWVAKTVGTLDGSDVPAAPKDDAHVGDDPTLDFGFVEKMVSVGDKVWFDENADGIQDPTEDPIPGVTLVITDPDGNPVINVITGKPVEPVVTGPNGEYDFSELPALPPGEHYTVTIDYEKSEKALEDLVPTTPNAGSDRGKDSSTDSATSTDLTEDGDRDPTLDFGFKKAKVSVGNYVWIDVNRDGLQDGTDIPLAGVVMVLTGPDGKPVTDVFGKPVEPVATDATGHYLFSNLPTLPKGQSYTVTIDQTKSAEALKGLIPTQAGAGQDRGKDSSTNSASSTADLSKDKGEDLTLDFGFIRPRVSVGDYVWMDTDRDGIQDKKEKGIPGVVLVLTGPDGKPVVDVDGNPVPPVTTDKNGHYTFENLPVLAPGQSYTVTIDQAKSKKALKGLKTSPKGKGSDRGKDSSTNSAVSTGLTANEDRDPTLDFGFFNPDVESGKDGKPGKDSDKPGKGGESDKNKPAAPGAGAENGDLPNTGATTGLWSVAAGLLLLLAGVGMVMARRRRA